MSTTHALEARGGTPPQGTRLEPESTAASRRLRRLRRERLEALGQLLCGVAHDLRNALTVVRGNLELLSEQVDERPERELADNALQGVAHAERLIARLLTGARGRCDEDGATATVCLSSVAQGVADLLRCALRSNVELVLDLDPRAGRARGDRESLETAVLNLALNAQDAMPDGGTILLSTREVSLAGERAAAAGCAPGRYVDLAVADTGAGMSAAELERATERYFTTKAQGTGLGLSLVREAAEGPGGALLLVSVPGQGTTARLLLPQAD